MDIANDGHWITESGEPYADKLHRLLDGARVFRFTSPEERHEIRCLARDGVPKNVIAQDYRISVQTVLKICRREHKED